MPVAAFTYISTETATGLFASPESVLTFESSNALKISTSFYDFITGNKSSNKIVEDPISNLSTSSDRQAKIKTKEKT